MDERPCQVRVLTQEEQADLRRDMQASAAWMQAELRAARKRADASASQALNDVESTQSGDGLVEVPNPEDR